MSRDIGFEIIATTSSKDIWVVYVLRQGWFTDKKVLLSYNYTRSGPGRIYHENGDYHSLPNREACIDLRDQYIKKNYPTKFIWCH